MPVTSTPTEHSIPLAVRPGDEAAERLRTLYESYKQSGTSALQSAIQGGTILEEEVVPAHKQSRDLNTYLKQIGIPRTTAAVWRQLYKYRSVYHGRATSIAEALELIRKKRIKEGTFHDKKRRGKKGQATRRKKELVTGKPKPSYLQRLRHVYELAKGIASEKIPDETTNEDVLNLLAVIGRELASIKRKAEQRG
jgi:hypothetical protein